MVHSTKQITNDANDRGIFASNFDPLNLFFTVFRWLSCNSILFLCRLRILSRISTSKLPSSASRVPYAKRTHRDSRSFAADRCKRNEGRNILLFIFPHQTFAGRYYDNVSLSANAIYNKTPRGASVENGRETKLNFQSLLSKMIRLEL